ncbi:MAG: MBL fold metallo-hydrolase [Desulfobacterales bacterium]|nr:MAG: MBL fold metallo-hydrolase [Desulfobacterales bacterium]
MDIKQIRLAKMATFCYLIGDRNSRTCALIDPAFETDRILEKARESEYRVTHLINTHAHSDHTAGNGAIKAATGAQILIHELDAKRLEKFLNKTFSRMLGGKGSPKPDILLKDNDIINVGEIHLSVLHTPGHTPGGICLHAAGHIFTGDTLFVGAVGRTDLPGGSLKQLLTSIREKIYTLSADTIVWPGHDYGPLTSSTVQQEIDTNPFTR